MFKGGNQQSGTLYTKGFWAHKLRKSNLAGFKSSNLFVIFAHPSPACQEGNMWVGTRAP